MSDIEIGGIAGGKVTGITNYGAFVQLPSGASGLVHISEITHTYVSDIAEHLAVGQDVTVKILGTEKGRMKLSIKQAAPPPPAEPPRRDPTPRDGGDDSAFEDKLRRFLKDSGGKNSGARGYTDRKGRRRGR